MLLNGFNMKLKHNKAVKNVRSRSLGLSKRGAALLFLKAPYLSRYIFKENQ